MPKPSLRESLSGLTNSDGSRFRSRGSERLFEAHTLSMRCLGGLQQPCDVFYKVFVAGRGWLRQEKPHAFVFRTLKMTATPSDLFKYLNNLHISYETLEHEPLFTVEDSRDVHVKMPGGHIKNLLVKDKKSRIFLLVALADAQINLKTVHEKLGASGRVSFCSAEIMDELLGVKPGSVTPFGVLNDTGHVVTLVLEASMMEQARLNCHPLVNTMTTGLASADLLKFVRETGHEPQIIAFAEPEISARNTRRTKRFDMSDSSAQPLPHVKATTHANFRSDVLSESMKVPVLVDFWAPWCGPCKQLTPVLEKIVQSAGGKIKLVTMNIEEYPQIAGQLGVQSIPAVFAFQKGQPVDGFMGALPESQIKAFIERLVGPLSSDLDAVIREADAALAAQDYGLAAEKYSAVLVEDEQHLRAIGGLTRTYVAVGELDQASSVLTLVPHGKETDPAIVAAKAALDLALKAADLGDLAGLEQMIAQDPANYQARFDLALGLNALARRDEAADQLLYIIKRDRSWNDDGARKQLLQFFESWGPMDPSSVTGRRKLSVILFS
eukprot:gene2363-2397_t